MTKQGTISILVALIWISGCATPMVSTVEELQNLVDNEGVVYGSVFLTVEPGPDNESGWAFLKGRKADRKDWEVSISEPKLFAKTYAIPAKPGLETVFIKKLPAGTYEILKVYQPGLFGGCCEDNQIFVEVKARFTVIPGQVSYIGKLTIKLPYRVKWGNRVFIGISDDQEEALEQLHGEFSAVLKNSVRDLAM